MKVGDRDSDVMAEINITPFTDVLLVLLIIFMIAASAVMKNGFNINLPKAMTRQEVEASNIVISITRDKQVYVGSRVLNRAELLPHLRRLREEKKTDKVIIMADGDVTYAEVVAVMDTAKEADLTSMALATQQKDATATAVQ